MLSFFYVMLTASALFALTLVQADDAAPAGSVKMQLINHANAPIDIFWINIFDEGLEYPNNLLQQNLKPIRNNSDMTLNSFDTHEFIIRYNNHIPGVEASFIKGPRDEILTVRYNEEEGMTVVSSTKYDELRGTVNDSAKKCAKLREDKDKDAFSRCVATAVAEDMLRISETKADLSKYHDMLADRLRNYTCSDPKVESTIPEESYNYTTGGRTIRVDSLLNMSHAKIWTVDNFATDEECEILMKHGRPRLTRATVAAEDGSSVISIHRKAQQASYTLNKRNPEMDPLWSLYQRIMMLTNDHTGFNLKPAGQEDFTIIQYNVADQYTPHCDGECDGSGHNSGGRVATAVLYCQVAEEGGATTFTKSDIFVKPKRKSATFFSYKGPDGLMDEGFTQHSGCPVTKGEKWITTAWMREGVSDENPWTLYDPSGFRLLEDEATQKTAAYASMMGGPEAGEAIKAVAAKGSAILSTLAYWEMEAMAFFKEHAVRFQIGVALLIIVACLAFLQFHQSSSKLGGQPKTSAPGGKSSAGSTRAAAIAAATMKPNTFNSAASATGAKKREAAAGKKK